MYQAANYIDVAPALKTAAIHRLVASKFFSSDNLRSLTTLHEGMTANDKLTDGNKRKKTQRLKDEFLSHNCTESCLLSKEAARESGTSGPSLGTDKFFVAAGVLKLRLGWKTRTGEKRKQQDEEAGENQLAKKQRTGYSVDQGPESTTDKPDETRGQPFELTSQEEKTQILTEFIDATCNSAMKKTLCSFCGYRASASETT
jgi:hypothetical protein